MKEWFKARNVWGATILALSDEEAGRIAKAIWSFTMNGEIVELSGAEKGIFPMILMTLEQDEAHNAEVSAKRSAIGSLGGKQKVANATNCYQLQANDSNCYQKVANEAIGNNKNKNKNKESEKESESEFILDDEAVQIQNDHNTILDAAQNAGFKSTPAERAGLLNLYAVHGLEKMQKAISECVKHSAPNLAYLEAVLKGTGKKQNADARDVHNYDQRDYSNAQSEAIKRMMDDSWGDEKEGAQ